MNQLVQWNPFRELEEMERRLARFAPDAERDNDDDSSAPQWEPAVDIYEDDEAYIFQAELPAVTKENVDVQLESGVLVLTGERKAEHERKTRKYHRVERAYGTFSRRFELPDDIDAANVHATFKDGILTVTVAKAERAKPRKINVKIG